MPKQIPMLKETLLREGRKVLEGEGYQAFTMRYVAEKCGIGLGTAYNYFENKDVLLGTIMLEDWEKTLDLSRSAVNEAEDPLERARILYGCVSEFSDLYGEIWAQYSGSRKRPGNVKDKHENLIRELCEYSRLNRFTVEILVYFSTYRVVPFSELEPELKKLLG